MSRSERLLDLIQILRRHRRAVGGAELARELGVSLRTLYRDIRTLTANGAPIDGEAGIGYVLRPGYTLPPLMFSEEEVEAIVLGARMVAASADPRLARAALDALAKVAAMLPGARRGCRHARPPLGAAPATRAGRGRSGIAAPGNPRRAKSLDQLQRRGWPTPSAGSGRSH